MGLLDWLLRRKEKSAFIRKDQKTVTVFVDVFAKEDLEKHGNLSPVAVLGKIIDIYERENSLPFRYIGEIKVKEWRYSKWWMKVEVFIFQLAEFLTFRFSSSKDLLQVLLYSGAEELYKKEGSDVCIFLTGLMGAGNGLAWPDTYKTGCDGNGIMMIGTKDEIVMQVYLPDNPDMPVVYELLDYKLRLALVGVHEQGHLYGLKHVDDQNSIMYKFSNSALKFDPASREKLLKILNFRQED